MTLAEAIQTLRRGATCEPCLPDCIATCRLADRDFCRGLCRGAGLILASLVFVICGACAIYPLIAQPQGASGQAPQSTPTPAFRIFLPIIHAPPPVKGVALTWGTCDAVENLSADWYYNWHWGSGCSISAEFVPMIRDVTRMGDLPEAVEYAQASGWLLGFNEPDMPEPYGYLTTPAEGAEAWRIIEQQAVGIRLVSPVPSQEDFDWLWRMVAEYEILYGEKPRFDAIGVHWYNWVEPSSVQAAKDHLLQVRQQALVHGYDVPLWLTEFAGRISQPDPQGGHQRLMEEFVPWVEHQPWITRYAWFATLIKPVESWCAGCQYCSLTYEGGGLTPIGVTYRGSE